MPTYCDGRMVEDAAIQKKGSPIWRKCVSIRGVCIIAGLLFLGGCVAIPIGIHRQIKEAKQFCESLIPILDQERNLTGRYPAALRTSWWKGKDVPTLIELDYLYLPYSKRDAFYLRIENPYAFWDNVIGYSSVTRGWIEHDSNRNKVGWQRVPPHVDN